jgi:4-amino-4-deoxy-L-arabinose transferase-like glycosyltransferase
LFFSKSTRENETVSPPRTKLRFFLLGFGAFLIYLAFLPPGIYTIDANSMLAVSDSLLHGSVSVPAPYLGTRGPNGMFYSNWYPLLSVVSLPFVALGSAAAHFFELPVHYVEAICALLVPALCTACTIPLVSLLAVQLGADNKSAYWAGLVYGFGTIALVYARDFLAEPLLALIIASALCLAFRERAGPAAILSSLAVLAKPTGVFIGPLLSAYLFAKTRKLVVSAIPAIGSAVGLGLYALYNAFRFGHPFTFGQPWAFAMHTIPEGFAGLLVSPGWGLLWYSPCAVLGLAAIPYARKRWEALTILGVFLSLLGLHAPFAIWNGGWSWGPRYLLPALPGLIALTALLPAAGKKATLALALVTFILTAPTMFSFYKRYLAEAYERNVPSSELTWSPAASPLVHAWPAAIRQCRDAANHDVRALFAAAGTPAHTIDSSRALRIVAVWWWVLPIARVPRSLGVVVSVLLLIAGFTALAFSSPRYNDRRNLAAT